MGQIEQVKIEDLFTLQHIRGKHWEESTIISWSSELLFRRSSMTTRLRMYGSPNQPEYSVRHIWEAPASSENIRRSGTARLSEAMPL